jgi:anti-anti-sigma regulatory factor
MLNLVKTRTEDCLTVILSGSLVQEALSIEKLLGEIPARLRLNCKHVARINSQGVRAWIQFLQKTAARGTEVIFEECSTAMVQTLNMVSNFTRVARIESVYLPFACTSCHSELQALAGASQLARAGYRVSTRQACPKCGGKAEFDDRSHEYFACLQRAEARAAA